MQLTEIDFAEHAPIEGYGPGFFRIAGDVIHGGLLILPGLRRAWTGYDDLNAVLEMADKIDVLFIGTGSEIDYIPTAIRDRLDAAGIGVETMASPSACRTFNVLLSEGRRIGLAAFPVGDAA